MTAPIPDSTRLAVDRTRLSHDRTLMAWVRTAVSLISFGFTIYKFFQAFDQQREHARERLLGSNEFALIMIGIGLAALVLATFQHVREIRAMRAEFPGVRIPRSLAVVLAILVAAFGVLALLAVALGQ